MEQHFGEVNSGFHKEVSISDKPTLIKIHDNDVRLANKADLIFTSVRDRHGIEKSIRRINKWDDTYSPENTLGMMVGWLFWCERADFIQTYKETQNMPKLIKRYVDFLQFDLDPKKVLNQLEKEMQDPGEDKILEHDSKTLLHHKHKSEW